MLRSKMKNVLYIENKYMTSLNKVYFFTVSVASVSGEVLEIARVSRLHMGAYLCIASNKVPPSVSKRVVLKVDCK